MTPITDKHYEFIADRGMSAWVPVETARELEEMCEELAEALTQSIAWNDGERTAINKLAHARPLLARYQAMKA